MHAHAHTYTNYNKLCNIVGNQQRGDTSEISIEMVKCGAYEIVQLSRQRVTMNDNPAYGEIGFLT